MRPARISSSPEGGLTLIELMIAITITAIVAVMAFEFFIQNEDTFLRNEGTGNVLNTDRHALATVANDIANAGYGIAGISGCNVIYRYHSGNAEPLTALSVTPSGPPASSAPSPVSLTIYMSASNYAGVPLGVMVDSPSPNASNFHLSSRPGAAVCETPIQKGSAMIAAFQNGVCGLVYATKTPPANAGACVVTIDHGENANNPSGGFAALIPGLTQALMSGAQVYDLGNSGLNSLTYSVTPAQGGTSGILNLTVGDTGKPEPYARGVDDLQVLFGYNLQGGQSVQKYGYYDPTYADDVRTVTVAIVAQSDIQARGQVAPGKIAVLPAIPASESVTGQSIPAIYYKPQAGTSADQYVVMRTTVPVLNLIWQ